MQLRKGQIFGFDGSSYWHLVYDIVNPNDDNFRSYYHVRVGERPSDNSFYTAESRRGAEMTQATLDSHVAEGTLHLFGNTEESGMLETISDSLNMEAQDGHMTPEQVDGFVERVNARLGESALTGVISTDEQEVSISVTFSGPQVNLEDALAAFQTSLEQLGDNRFADCTAAVTIAA